MLWKCCVAFGAGISVVRYLDVRILFQSFKNLLPHDFELRGFIQDFVVEALAELLQIGTFQSASLHGIEVRPKQHFRQIDESRNSTGLRAMKITLAKENERLQAINEIDPHFLSYHCE